MNTNAMHPSVGLKRFNFFGPAVSCSAAAPVVDVRALLTAVTIWSTSAAPTPNMQHTLVALWGLVSLVTVMLIPTVHLAAMSGEKAIDLQTSPVREVRSQAPEQPAVDREKESGSASLTSLKDGFDEDEKDDFDENENDDQFSARGRGSFDSGVDERVSGARANFTKTCECGQKVNRIVGGHETHISEYPWQVALIYRGTSEQFCGGSLITNSHILSAAHCFVKFNLKAEDVEVRLREHHLTTPSETEMVTRTVSKIYNHENYDKATENNDIAILKLSSPVTISSTLLPVCLPSSRRKKYSGKEATVSGWGALAFGSELEDYPNVLREVTVPVLSPKACKEKTHYAPSEITDQMLCAGKAGLDSCQGDSGGPLVFRNKKGRHDQIGIVSWGKGCAAEGYPGVYTRVNKFLGWIENRTKDGVYCMGSRFPSASK